ncbi:three-Cys-motif partner protein TcmP [Roseomonas gilardii]|uniref:three-Cys-motif partner protein TcmP n=1 Tax=Roseomonas gilardii TaxID=257708 RepID=UPI0004840171|nr:three-Cys-motif partner protein TcmP [Roseomonas gilardii]SUE63178.1 Uncharacterised protein [Roseomonas gilardii subsp. rosea]
MDKGPRKPAKVSIRREDYVGRGQTYVKHLFLREYLLELAFKVLQAPNARPDFLYVDGFSGPWRSTAQTHTDTSFHVALSVLTEVANSLSAKGIKPRMRAVFVERDRRSFPVMAEAVKRFDRIETTVIPGEFEEAIPQIVGMVDGAFTFSFVDPTGWKGLALDRLAPLLRLRGEVLVNMMTNSLNRHLGLQSVRGGFNQYFGGPGWEREYIEAFKAHRQREEAVRLTYLSRLKDICDYRYVGTTRVRFEDKQRTYFHLAYGTRHPKGMEVFRRVERKVVEAQEDLAYNAHIQKTSMGGAIPDLFAGVENPNLGVFRLWQEQARGKARQEFENWLETGSRERQDHLAALLMQHPHVDLKLAESWIREAEAVGGLMRQGSGGGASLTPKVATDIGMIPKAAVALPQGQAST